MTLKANKLYLWQVSVFLLSAGILGLGTTFVVCAGVGADALSTMALGLSKHINVTVDILIFAIMYVMMGIAYLFDKKKVGFLSLVYPFISTAVMRNCMKFIHPENQITAFAVLSIGILCMAIAITMGSKVRICCNPYDALAFSGMEKFNCSYSVVRWVIDGSYLLSGILLGSTVGLGTILILVCLGPCTDTCMKVSNILLTNKEFKKGK